VSKRSAAAKRSEGLTSLESTSGVEKLKLLDDATRIDISAVGDDPHGRSPALELADPCEERTKSANGSR
jgi:hypothetical protein